MTATDTTVGIDDVVEPTSPGWYASAGGNDYLIYLRREDINIPGVLVRTNRWMAFTRDGDATVCEWGYIAQAGPVVPLMKQAIR